MILSFPSPFCIHPPLLVIHLPQKILPMLWVISRFFTKKVRLWCHVTYNMLMQQLAAAKRWGFFCSSALLPGSLVPSPVCQTVPVTSLNHWNYRNLCISSGFVFFHFHELVQLLQGPFKWQGRWVNRNLLYRAEQSQWLAQPSKKLFWNKMTAKPHLPRCWATAILCGSWFCSGGGAGGDA